MSGCRESADHAMKDCEAEAIKALSSQRRQHPASGYQFPTIAENDFREACLYLKGFELDFALAQKDGALMFPIWKADPKYWKRSK
jgi:hypothetical protein